MLSIRQPSEHIILHTVDERIRWSVAVEVSSNTPEDTVDDLMIIWVKIYGKPEMMTWGGERAMVSVEALQ